MFLKLLKMFGVKSENVVFKWMLQFLLGRFKILREITAEIIEFVWNQYNFALVNWIKTD